MLIGTTEQETGFNLFDWRGGGGGNWLLFVFPDEISREYSRPESDAARPPITIGLHHVDDVTLVEREIARFVGRVSV